MAGKKQTYVCRNCIVLDKKFYTPGAEVELSEDEIGRLANALELKAVPKASTTQKAEK